MEQPELAAACRELAAACRELTRVRTLT
jgi:hypothetical protein